MTLDVWRLQFFAALQPLIDREGKLPVYGLDGGRMRLGRLEIAVERTISSIVITWYEVTDTPEKLGRAGQHTVLDLDADPTAVAKFVAEQLG